MRRISRRGAGPPAQCAAHTPLMIPPSCWGLTLVPRHPVGTAHRLGLPAFACTIDGVEQMRHLRGMDGKVTGRPDLLEQVFS